MEASDLAPGSTAVPAVPGGPLASVVAGFLLGYASEHTRRSYTGDLRAWFAFCTAAGIAPLEARRAHVDAWARALEAGGASARTVARRIASLASFSRYLLDAGQLGASPVDRVRRPAVDPDDSPTVGLDQEQGRALLHATHGHGSTRDVAVVSLLLTNGLRIDEALSRDVAHLGHERGHRTLRIRRKGGTQRTTALPATVARALDASLAGRTAGPLFVTQTGRRYDRSSAFRMLRRMARLAGLDVADRLSLHSLRHSAITAALDAGRSLRDVQDFAGHADPRTTRRYDRSRHNLDRSAAYSVAAWFADEETTAVEESDTERRQED